MLKPINFKNSIRAEHIQYNFDELERRIRSESLTTGGQGIVEGMDIIVKEKLKFEITPGRYIDTNGDEVFFEGGEYYVKEFEPIRKEVEKVKVNSHGQVTLEGKPYSSHFDAYFSKTFYEYIYPTSDLIIKGSAAGTTIKAVNIENEVITIDAHAWANKEVDIEYLYARNRMDTVFVSKDKGVFIATGTMSPSISHADIPEYKDAVVIGMIEVNINKSITLIAHYNERQTRPVYVNDENVLHLNGSPYRRIFFVLPELPVEQDIYIDYKNGNIYSFLRVDGMLQWVKVNGPSSVIQKEIKIISPEDEDYPEDFQCFLFDKDEDIKYRFIPGENQLEVIVDNSPLMSDQYKEIVSEDEGINNGIGIKLNDPLDKPAHIEVRVTHNVESSVLGEAYKKTASFAKESISYVKDGNTLFLAAAPYRADEYQLEVYREGQRMYRDNDYFETNEFGEYVEKGEIATHFKFAYDLSENEEVINKVVTTIYSYDHIAKILENTYGSLKDLIDNVTEMTAHLDTALDETEERLFLLESATTSINESLKSLNDFAKKDDIVKKDKIDKEVLSNIKKETFEQVYPCDGIFEIKNAKKSDLLFIFKVKNRYTEILFDLLDYSIESLGDDLLVTINDDLVDSAANILVKGVKFGE